MTHCHMDMPELQAVMAYARRNWNQVALRATSIVAWFRMLAFRETPPVQSLFVSPVLDMAELIETMRGWAGVTAAELEARQAVMEEGEHWFHTPEQLAVLEPWTTEHL